MDEIPEWFRLHVKAANHQVTQAKSGDGVAGRCVLEGAVVGLRGWLLDFDKPDPHRLVYLNALLESLQSIVNGEDPADALHIKKRHRVASEVKAFDEVKMWVDVGKELDRLTAVRGHTRSDKPIAAAIKFVAKARGVSRAKVGKAWGAHGAEAGWRERKSDWT